MSKELFSKDLSDSEEEEDSGLQHNKSDVEEEEEETEVAQGTITNDERNPATPLLEAPLESSTSLSKPVQFSKWTRKSQLMLEGPAATLLASASFTNANPSNSYFIDETTVELMSLLDRYLSLQNTMGKGLSDGFFHASQAKYKSSTSFSASNAFPSTEALREEFSEFVRLLPKSPLSDGDPAAMVEDDEEDDVDLAEEEEKSCFKTVDSIEDLSQFPSLDVDELVNSTDKSFHTVKDGKEEPDPLVEIPYAMEICTRGKGTLEEYLLQFHGFPSLKLKQTQKDFHLLIVEQLCEIVHVKQRIHLLLDQIRDFQIRNANHTE